MSKKIKRYGATIPKHIMKLLLEILKNTYSITFKEDVSYEWSPFIEPFINSATLYQDLVSKNLLKNEETQEDIQYWQDLFFMEIAELSTILNVEEQLYEQIKNHPLFISNSTFLNHIPRATVALGRELLIDELIDNKNADDFINDEMIENVFKKKSRDELRQKFDEWNDEDEFSQPTGTNIYQKNICYSNSDDVKKSAQLRPKSKSKLYFFKYLIAASIVAFGLFIWQPTQSSDVELLAYYNSNLESLSQNNLESLDFNTLNSSTRGDEMIFQNLSAIESEDVLLALSYFKDKNYDQAKAKLEELRPRGKNDQVLFFLALSQSKTNNVDESITNLEFLNGQEDFGLLDDVKFHLAMAYLKKGDRNKSKNLLKELKSSDSNVSREAKIIFDKMRWF